MASSKQIARATLPGNRRALSIVARRLAQLVVPGHPHDDQCGRPRVRQGLSTINSHTTGGGVGVGVPLRERRRHVFTHVELLDVEISTISETGVERSFWSAEDRQADAEGLRFGAKLNLVGMALTLLAAEQVVGTLIMKALVAPGSLAGVWSGTAPSGLTAFNTIDVFVIQATTNPLRARAIPLAGLQHDRRVRSHLVVAR